MEFILKEHHRNISDEDFVKDLQRVAKLLNKENLTMEEYVSNGKFHCSTVRRRFGSWANALEKANLRVTRHQQFNITYSKEDVLTDIKQVYEEFGKIDRSTYDKKGKIGIKRLLKIFKNWEEALIAADLPLNSGSKHIKDEDLLSEIENIWIKLGRQPTSNDIKNGISKYSLNTYSRRFGSWRNTLETFVKNINSEKEFDKSNEGFDKSSPQQYTSNQNIDIRKTKRDINLRLRFLVMKRDNFKCCICGRSPSNTPNLELHIDHIQPWAKGGETIIDNLQTLCSDCNLGKSDLE